MGILLNKLLSKRMSLETQLGNTREKPRSSLKKQQMGFSKIVTFRCIFVSTIKNLKTKTKEPKGRGYLYRAKSHLSVSVQYLQSAFYRVNLSFPFAHKQHPPNLSHCSKEWLKNTNFFWEKEEFNTINTNVPPYLWPLHQWLQLPLKNHQENYSFWTYTGFSYYSLTNTIS